VGQGNPRALLASPTLGMQVLERVPPQECREVKKGVLGALGFARRDCAVLTKNVFAPQKAQGSVTLSYGDNEKETVSILLTPQTKKKGPPPTGTMYQKLAILTKDSEAAAKAADIDGATVNFIGPVPGIGTKVGAVTDPAGYGLVFVDYADFENEQPKM